MTNAERREIVEKAKADGYQGSYVDLFKQAAQNPAVVQHGTQQSVDGLRPAHQAGNTDASMAFTDVPPNTPFNTVGMKKPIDIKKYDRQGHLVKSYESVPPGIKSLNTGPGTGTVVETPARMQQGNFTNSDIPRVPALSDAEMSLKIIQEANSGNPAARRMRSDYGQRMFLEGETDPSTHYMGSFGKYAVPLVQENYTGGPLSYKENPAPGKADFKFDTPEQADYFARNYKGATAAKAFSARMQEGGPRTEPFWEDALELAPGIGTFFSLDDAYYAVKDMFQNPGEIGFNQRTASNVLDIAGVAPGGKAFGAGLGRAMSLGNKIIDLNRVRNIDKAFDTANKLGFVDDRREAAEENKGTLLQTPKPLTPIPPTKLPTPGGKYSFRIGGVRYNNSRYRK
jgi:hypothetical protein